MKKQAYGFSLVELSVVLVVIGLILAGVMAGSSLSDSARKQAAVNDFSKYRQAAYSFYEKYTYWPGDFPSASSNWSGVSNGDGDGTLEDPDTSATEYYLFWYHLKQAGFLTGNFTGSAGSIPVSAFEMGNVTHMYDVSSATKQAFIITSASVPASSDALGSISIIDGRNAFYIDKKMDDSVANTGDVRGNGNCITSNQYELTTDDLCSLYYYYKNY